MSVKAGSGRVESGRQPWDAYVWQRVGAKLRTAGLTEVREQVEARLHDRVAEVYAPADAIRMAELTRLARLGPDPDEDTTEDPNALRWPCEACHQAEGYLPHKSSVKRYGITKPCRLCPGCRAAGWRSSRCECGKPLHHRDYASNSKGGRAMGTKCGACRQVIRAEYGLSGVRA